MATLDRGRCVVAGAYPAPSRPCRRFTGRVGSRVRSRRDPIYSVAPYIELAEVVIAQAVEDGIMLLPTRGRLTSTYVHRDPTTELEFPGALCGALLEQAADPSHPSGTITATAPYRNRTPNRQRCSRTGV